MTGVEAVFGEFQGVFTRKHLDDFGSDADFGVIEPYVGALWDGVHGHGNSLERRKWLQFYGKDTRAQDSGYRSARGLRHYLKFEHLPGSHIADGKPGVADADFVFVEEVEREVGLRDAFAPEIFSGDVDRVAVKLAGVANLLEFAEAETDDRLAGGGPDEDLGGLVFGEGSSGKDYEKQNAKNGSRGHGSPAVWN